jgi:hypothetical protein
MLSFHVFSEELLHVAMWQAEGQGAKKEVCFAHRILVFHFSSLFFCSWFCMMSPSMWPLRSKCEVFDSFQEILQGP